MSDCVSCAPRDLGRHRVRKKNRFLFGTAALLQQLCCKHTQTLTHRCGVGLSAPPLRWQVWSVGLSRPPSTLAGVHIYDRHSVANKYSSPPSPSSRAFPPSFRSLHHPPPPQRPLVDFSHVLSGRVLVAKRAFSWMGFEDASSLTRPPALRGPRLR